jgi:hypothetical protein
MNSIFDCCSVANDAAQMSIQPLAFAEEPGVTRVISPESDRKAWVRGCNVLSPANRLSL